MRCSPWGRRARRHPGSAGRTSGTVRSCSPDGSQRRAPGTWACIQPLRVWSPSTAEGLMQSAQASEAATPLLWHEGHLRAPPGRAARLTLVRAGASAVGEERYEAEALHAAHAVLWPTLARRFRAARVPLAVLRQRRVEGNTRWADVSNNNCSTVTPHFAICSALVAADSKDATSAVLLFSVPPHPGGCVSGRAGADAAQAELECLHAPRLFVTTTTRSPCVSFLPAVCHEQQVETKNHRRAISLHGEYTVEGYFQSDDKQQR